MVILKIDGYCQYFFIIMENKDTELVLTHSQKFAFERFTSFLDEDDIKVYILKGYAGTGKTTLVRKFIEEMNLRKLNFALLASTGRAAKILSNTTGFHAKTVHSEIYKFIDLNQDLATVAEKKEQNLMDSTGQLFLNFDLWTRDDDEQEEKRFYIVDEASMISDEENQHATQAVFGSGRLLHDLLAFDKKAKFIFVGDACQLPPVNEAMSPALDAGYFHNEFDEKAIESELTQIVRQGEDNDIVLSAQKVRHLYFAPQPWKWAKFPLKGYKNIHILDSQTELIAKYIETVREHDFNTATMICLTNRQASQVTQIVRPAFGHVGSLLEKGDLLLVTQNNLISGLMNGDLVVVENVGEQERRAGLTFVKIIVKELFTQQCYSQLLIAEVLYGNLTNITQYQHRDLMIDFYYRMKELKISQKSDFFKVMMMEDPYLNALRAVFGYSLTCHKAQGGEWDMVFLDIARNVPALNKPYVYQWVYTAMTRARKDLYVVKDFWLI